MIRSCPGFLALVATVCLSAGLFGVQLDPTFGTGGIVNSPPEQTLLTGLALQHDGKIVAVGTVSGGGGLALIRYGRNGALDPSFGDGGVSSSFSNSNAFASALAIAPDGRIVVVGFLYVASTPTFLVARYLSNGSLDSSFGIGGFTTTSLTPQGDSASSVVVQPDGRIVVAGGGGASPFGSQDFDVVRYNVDGSLDSSFGLGGMVVVAMGGGGVSVALRPDGRLVVGGSTISETGPELFALLGLLPSGDPDPGFGSNGRVFSQVGGYAIFNGLSLMRDGKVVAAGTTLLGQGSDLAVVRYRTDGSLDPTFATNGIFTKPLDGPTPNAVAVDSQNRVVIAGMVGGSFGLLRILANGTLDPAVGPQGWTSVLGGAPPNISAGANAVLVQPDGGVVLGGTETFEFVTIVALVRYVDTPTTIPALSLSGSILLMMVLGLAGLLATQRAA